MKSKDYNAMLSDFIDIANSLDRIQMYARFGIPLNITLDALDKNSLSVISSQQGSIIASQWVNAMQRALHLVRLFRNDILSSSRLIPFDEIYEGLNGTKYTLDSFVRYMNRESSRYIKSN